MTAISEPADRVLEDVEDHAPGKRHSFASLGVDPLLVDALAEQGITVPFAIQAMTVADALAGRDVCGKAKTGSGKTLAFGVPLLQRTMASKSDRAGAPSRPRARPHPRAGAPGERGARTTRRAGGTADRRGLRRCRHRAADQEGAPRSRRGHRDTRAAHRSRRPGRAVGGRHRDPGARRGGPHGRHGLHAPGRMGAPPSRATPPDPPVLGDPRRRGRPPGQPLHDRPGPPRGGLGDHHRRRHGAPVPRGASDGQDQGLRGDLPQLGEDARLRPHQARRRPPGPAAAQGRGEGRRDPRGPAPGLPRAHAQGLRERAAPRSRRDRCRRPWAWTSTRSTW